MQQLNCLLPEAFCFEQKVTQTMPLTPRFVEPSDVTNASIIEEAILVGTNRARTMPKPDAARGRIKSTQHKKFSVAKSAKKHWRKPKSMPKRPLSAYNLFFAEERQRLLNCSGDQGSTTNALCEQPQRCKLGFAGLARTVASNWKKLDPAKKEDFQRRSERERQRYRILVQEWKRKRSLGTKRGRISNEHRFVRPIRKLTIPFLRASLRTSQDFDDRDQEGERCSKGLSKQQQDEYVFVDCGA